MKIYRSILFIRIIEIAIGGATLLGIFFSLLFSLNTKPPNILFFVTIAACVSTGLGIGMIKTQKWAYQLLLYFASVIILSKILILLSVIHLSGALISVVPAWLNDLISLGYHGWLFFYLHQPKIKELFHI